MGSCGHELRGVDDNILSIKEYDRSGERVVATICVCDDCIRWYRKHRLILKDKKAEDKWFAGNKRKYDEDDW